MTIKLSGFAQPIAWEAIPLGGIVLAARENTVALAMKIELPDGSTSVFALRHLSGEPARDALTARPPRYFSFAILAGMFVAEPVSCLASLEEAGPIADGSMTLTSEGKAFIRFTEGTYVNYLDLETAKLGAAEGTRIFYDSWRLVRRGPGIEETVLAFGG
jgi:hypothetical protein